MKKEIKYFIYITLAGYVAIGFVSVQTANFLMALLLILMIPFLILRWIFMNQLYKYSINKVSRQFVLNQNALHNEHCTVIYTPDEKIVVMDNIADRTHAKRMFTLKKGQLNVNRAWNRACRIFDSFITLDSLASFYRYDTRVEVITLEQKITDAPKEPVKKEINIQKSEQGPSFVELDSVKPDPFGLGGEKANESGASFVALDNIKEQKQSKERVQEEPEFVEIGDIMSKYDKKIDVNNVEAGELAILPGINIVMAKKIIEHRNLNGLFKTPEEFIQVADVKEYFIPKIKSMIVVGAPAQKKNNDDYNEGRIVDF
ncbi:helix-hairpin-helix domain-containing protein [bacterium]|nr:helix-hairpin-helix domain-containing protein [bacterium]MBQ9246935.1 helix-hairpin-helix domain-containing protein [bacterium]